MIDTRRGASSYQALGMWLFSKAQQVRIYAAFDFSCSATVQLAPHCLCVPVRLASILFCLDAARTSRHAPPTTGKSWSSCTIRIQTDIHGATYRCCWFNQSSHKVVPYLTRDAYLVSCLHLLPYTKVHGSRF